MDSKVASYNQADAYEAGRYLSESTSLENAKVSFVFSSVKYDQEKLLEGIKSVDAHTPVIGCTSHSLITNEGIINGPEGFAGMLTLAGKDLDVAVSGSAKLDTAYDTGVEVAKQAQEKFPHLRPSYFFMVATTGEEEDYLQGIQSVLGEIPVFGGGASDDNVDGSWFLLKDKETIKEGVCIAVFFTLNNARISCGSGYKKTGDVGFVTSVKSDNRTIVEIDHEPALIKYAEWLGKQKEDLLGQQLLSETLFNPLGIESYTGGPVIVHHPMVGNEDGTFYLGNNVAEFASVIRLQATTDDLLKCCEDTIEDVNRYITTPGAYLCIHCAGMGMAIGDRLEEVAEILKEKCGDVPFIVAFTYGEYGNRKALGNICCGLSLTFTGLQK